MFVDNTFEINNITLCGRWPKVEIMPFKDGRHAIHEIVFHYISNSGQNRNTLVVARIQNGRHLSVKKQNNSELSYDNTPHSKFVIIFIS